MQKFAQRYVYLSEKNVENLIRCYFTQIDLIELTPLDLF